MHLRIPLPLFVFGGAGRRDQGGINDRALSHRHASCMEMGFHGLIDEVLCEAVSEAGQYS